MVNEWRDGKWLAGVLDGSFTIYWETTKLSLDEVLRHSYTIVVYLSVTFSNI